MYYIIIESTQLKQLLSFLKVEHKIEPRFMYRNAIKFMRSCFFMTAAIRLCPQNFFPMISQIDYKLPDQLFIKKFNYLQVYEVLTNINVYSGQLFTKLYLITHIFRLSFILNSKYLTTITDLSEIYFEFYVKVITNMHSVFTSNVIYLNIKNALLKIANLLKTKKCLYKNPGNPYLKLRRIFPAINIAFRFKISKYVL